MNSHDSTSDRRPSNAIAEQLTGRARADSRRAAIRRRTLTIRRSVAAVAAALFSAAFLTLYVQLASGHDPALAKAAKHATSATASSGVTTSASASSASTGAEASSSAGQPSTGSESQRGSASAGNESSGGSSSAGGAESTQTPSAVTTSQS
jgi:hypothetical protein